MKKIFTLLTAVVAMLATSCVKDATDDVQVTGAEGLVTFTVEAPEFGSRTLIGNGQKATSLVYAVYDKNWEYLTEGTAEFQNLVANVSLRLVNNKEYNFVFWASVPGNTYYTLDTRTATVEVSYEGEANDENRDAFFGQLKGLVVDGTMNESVKLYRPFAQVNWGTNDVAEAKIGGFDITTAGTAVYEAEAYTSLSLKDGAVDGLTTVTFAANELVSNSYVDENDAAEQLVTKAGASYTWLAMNYLLWTADEGTLTYNKLTIEDNLGQKVVVSYPNANVRRNWRTNLVGSLLTDQTNITVEIVPGFEDQYDVEVPEYTHVADGVVVDAEGNYYISNGAGLKWVANEVNKVGAQEANIFDTKTVYLTNDIDLNGAEWLPIGDYGFNRTVFRGTFDGMGNTISNFKVTARSARPDKVAEASYGLFGNVSGTIKNVNLDNATIDLAVGRFAGALVGRLKDGSRVENCHVSNSTVAINEWQVGGLVGQNSLGNVVNCSVTGSTISGKAAVGALVGLVMVAGDYTIEGCRVVDTDLVKNGTYGESYDAMFGLAAGQVNASGAILNINNVEVSGNTIKGAASTKLVGSTVTGSEVLLNGTLAVSTEAELTAALNANQSIVLNDNIEMTARFTPVGKTFAIDGNGYTISQAASCNNNIALIDVTGGKVSLKNVVFDGIKKGALLRTVNAELEMDGVTVKNAAHTVDEGLLRLLGKSTIKNSTFCNNTCKMVISFGFDTNDDVDPVELINCTFEKNTCSSIAAVYYAHGSSALIDGNKFVENLVDINSNGATLYMGFTENNVITNNLFKNNTLKTTSSSKRVTAGIQLGYTTTVTGNAFIGNVVETPNAAKGNHVCASVYYTDIDLSGNYWGGAAPVENVDYFVEHTGHNVTINDYLTSYTE